jgi:DNA repair protein RadC
VHKITSTRDARDYFKNFYADKNDGEHLSVAFLDNQSRVIAAKIMFSGTVNETSVYPREIVKSALFYNAAGVMLAHNHPGGSEIPSSADIKMTDQITQLLYMVNVKMLDHIIVAGDNAVSLAEQGKVLVSDDLTVQKAASPVREDGRPLRVNTKQPSIKQQIAAGKKQLAAERAAAPLRAAAKSKNIGLGD